MQLIIVSHCVVISLIYEVQIGTNEVGVLHTKTIDLYKLITRGQIRHWQDQTSIYPVKRAILGFAQLITQVLRLSWLNR